MPLALNDPVAVPQAMRAEVGNVWYISAVFSEAGEHAIDAGLIAMRISRSENAQIT